MEKLKSILVSVNPEFDSHAAIQRAHRVAKQTGASLTLVDTLDGPPMLYPRLSPPPWILPSALVAEKTTELERLAQPVRDDGVSVETKVLHGKRSTEVVRQAIRAGHDLVMKVAEKPSRTVLFGATGMQLLRRCPCPVWLVKPAGNESDTRVLAAVDPSSDDPSSQALNTKIIEHARRVAQFQGAEMHVIHAWIAYGASVLRGRGGAQLDEVRRYRRSVKREAKAALERLLNETNTHLAPKNVHLIEGAPELVLPRFAKAKKFDLLVMGTVARSGISGLIIGNTAERLVGRVACSILALKPDGFLSPVKLQE